MFSNKNMKNRSKPNKMYIHAYWYLTNSLSIRLSATFRAFPRY